MKSLLTNLSCLLIIYGSILSLHGCQKWELPDLKLQRNCVTPQGILKTQNALLKVNCWVSDTSGTINTISWDLGNGSATSTTSLTITYTYPVSGTYTVKATLTNTCGQQTSLSKTISVTDQIGLVAYLPFTDQTLADKSQYGKNNALWGTTTTPTFTDDFRGRANSAIQLNGKTDYLILPDNPSIQFDTAFSISLWIKPDINVLNAATDRRMQIYNKSNFRTGANESYSSSMRAVKNVDNLSDLIYILADIRQGSSCQAGGNFWKSLVFTRNRSNFENNNWHHLVFAYDRFTAWLYLDGQLLDIKTSANSDLSASLGKIDKCIGGDLRFGVQNLNSAYAGNPYTNYYSGAMDEIRIYNRRLTEAEAEALYNAK